MSDADTMSVRAEVEKIGGDTSRRAEPTTTDVGGPVDEGDSAPVILFVRDMPDLEDVLKQVSVAYTVLERTDPMAYRSRVVWAWLVVTALGWGTVTGLSFGVDRFPVDPAAATLGWLGLLVLLATTWTATGHRD